MHHPASALFNILPALYLSASASLLTPPTSFFFLEYLKAYPVCLYCFTHKYFHMCLSQVRTFNTPLSNLKINNNFFILSNTQSKFRLPCFLKNVPLLVCSSQGPNKDHIAFCCHIDSVFLNFLIVLLLNLFPLSSCHLFLEETGLIVT